MVMAALTTARTPTSSATAAARPHQRLRGARGARGAALLECGEAGVPRRRPAAAAARAASEVALGSGSGGETELDDTVE
jgi:hypothetical protein